MISYKCMMHIWMYMSLWEHCGNKLNDKPENLIKNSQLFCEQDQKT